MVLNWCPWMMKSKSVAIIVEEVRDFAPSHPVRCPVCTQIFPSTNAVCEHLHNDPGCSQKFIPPPSAFTAPERSPDKPRSGRFHPTSGYIYHLSDSNTFERIKREDHCFARDNNPYFPFIDRDEWELAKFLYTHLTQAQINNFLKLRWVSTRFCCMCCSIMLVGYFEITDQFSYSTGTIIANGCNTQRTGLALHEDRS